MPNEYKNTVNPFYEIDESDQEIVKQCNETLQREINIESENRSEALENLDFELGHGQWSDKELIQRQLRGQVSLKVNLLPKYIKQVVGEIRQNKMKVKVRPVSSDADEELANIREGIIYNIEYQSNAETIYDYAGAMNVKCGYGAWRVLTKYSDTNIFQQEICLELIENPLAVYMDSSAKDKCYADARHGFIIDRIPRKRLEEDYPDKPINDGGGLSVSTPETVYPWDDGHGNLLVVEYFYTECKKEKMVLLSDGRTMKAKEAKEEIEGWKRTYEEAKDAGKEVDESAKPTIVKERKIESKQVKWAKVCGDTVLEKRDWPGKYIPIILIHGEDVNVGGKRYISGLINNAKDSQRMLNYWHTAAAETIALMPKSPWQATPEMIKGFEKDYLNAHQDNLPVLLYNADSRFPGRIPTRVPTNQAPAALFSEISRAEENIKSTIGMFNADVGDQGRELSGAAIQARQMPGDTSTFMYLDNLAKGITHSGKIVNDLISKIYVEERDARLHNADDGETFAPINTTVGSALQKVKENPTMFMGMDSGKLEKTAMKEGSNAVLNDVTQGEYDVVIDVGPSYATRRQQAADALIKLTMSSAQTNPVDKYFILENLDIPNSEEYKDAVRKTIPPGILPPKKGDEPPQPPQPSPQEIHSMQMEKIKLETEMLNRQVQIEKMKVEAERRKTEQAQQQVQLVKLYNEAEEGDFKKREQILGIIENQQKQFEQDQQRLNELDNVRQQQPPYPQSVGRGQM